MSSAVLSKNNLVHACSGSIASMIALALCYPLERVRNLAQLHSAKSTLTLIRSLYYEEGIMAFYRGMMNMIIVLGSSNFVYFYLFSFLKAFYTKRQNRTRIPGAVNLVLASIAGIGNVLLTTPLWVAATRVILKSKTKRETTNKPDDLFSTLLQIGKQEGVQGLWSGTTTSLILVSNPAIQFSAYERLKSNLLEKVGREKPLGAIQHLYLGALSKMVATILTYPLQVSQTRLRSEQDKSKSTIHCLSEIYREHGILGWFSGMDAKLFQTCITAAFMFAFYEKFAVIFKMFLLDSNTK